MKQAYYITSSCIIRSHEVYKDGALYYKGDPKDTIKAFTKAIYTAQELDYSKFYKMDELCKLSFLATEILQQGNAPIPSETALVLANRASSLATDRKHQESITDKEEYYPSPAIFVYTLPNIVIGELSIRHQLKSESAFFITETFDPDFMATYARILLDTKKASHVICGWVDLDTDKYDVFLALISTQGDQELTAKELNIQYRL